MSRVVQEDEPEAPEQHDLAGEEEDIWAPVFVLPFASVRLAVKRLRRTWRLLLPIALGMLVAITLLCAVPLYDILVANTLFQQSLTPSSASTNGASGATAVQTRRTASRINVDAVVDAALLPLDDADAIERQTAMVAQGTLGPYMHAATAYAETSDTLRFLTVNDADFSRLNPAVSFAFARPLAYDYSQAAPHMQLLEGRLPQDQPSNQPIETLATDEVGLHAGDLITLVDTHTGEQRIQMRVAGIWRPVDPSDPFWNDRSFKAIVETGSNSNPPPVFSLLVTHNAFFSGLRAIPSLTAAKLHHVFYPAPDRFTAQGVPAALAALTTFRNQFGVSLLGLVGVRSTTTVTGLDNILRGIVQQVGLLAQPLYIVVAQVVGLALLFIAAMTALLMDLQGGELATLKSRGASASQMVASLTLQSLPIATVAASAGLLLAPLLARVVLQAFLPGAAVGAATLLHPDTLAALLPPAVAGLALGLAALAVTAWLSARQEVLAFRREQGRVTQAPLWRRYHLDVLLVMLCVAGYLELGQFGGLDVREQLGQQSAGPDPLQLVTPGLILLAGGLVTLRLLPLGARVGAWVAARGRSAPALLAFAQVARATRQFSRLALLLTLAVGLAVFALTFNASLDRNAADRAAYAAGGDLRMQFSGPIRAFQFTRLNKSLATLPGVTAVTSFYRTSGFATPGEEGALTTILGIEPDTLGLVANWRTDFAHQPLGTLLRQLGARHVITGTSGTADAPIWALVSTGFAQTLHLQVGQPFTLVPQESTSAILYFTAGAFLDNFPTAYDTPGSFLLVNQDDLIGGLRNPATVNVSIGAPNEYWLRTTGVPSDDAARAAALSDPRFVGFRLRDRRALAGELRSGPLVAGLSGLLLAGAAAAALLAILGTLIQSLATVNQRRTQLAVLRTLGIARGQLTRLLLTEQTAIYCLGLVAGGLLGLLVSTAALPFLEFSGSSSGGDVPSTALPYILAFNPGGLLVFFGMLIGGFLLALLLSAGAAARGGLGTALRIGED